jgi:hypothetical protein
MREPEEETRGALVRFLAIACRRPRERLRVKKESPAFLVKGTALEKEKQKELGKDYRSESR